MKVSAKNLLFLLAASSMGACDPGDDEGADGDETSTTGDGDGDGDGAACEAYGDLVTSCYDSTNGDAATQACLYALENYEMAYGADCGDAYEAWKVCLSALSCEVIANSDEACSTEETTMEMTCGPG